MVKFRKASSDLGAFIYDRMTGEEKDINGFFMPKKVRGIPDYTAIWAEAAQFVAQNKNLSLQVHRVLWYILGNMDWGNKVLVTQADVRDGLGMHQSSVSKAFKSLVEEGILVELKKVGTTKIYYLNDNYGWKGKPEAWKEVQNDKANPYLRDQLKSA